MQVNNTKDKWCGLTAKSKKWCGLTAQRTVARLEVIFIIPSTVPYCMKRSESKKQCAVEQAQHDQT